MKILLAALPANAADQPVQQVQGRPSAVSSSAQSLSNGSKLNIIFILTDDQDYGDSARHAHPYLDTPHMDGLHDTHASRNASSRAQQHAAKVAAQKKREANK